MNNSFWFSIIDSDEISGGAFVIARKYALTATHCLPNDYEAASESVTPSQFTLVAEDGTDLLVTLSEVMGDLALLEIRAFRLHSITPPEIRVGEVDKDSLWEAPYRPSLQHPVLTGVVGKPDLRFRSADGSLISAIQLTVSEGVGDHSGYSGGPVVTKASDVAPPQILGILLEQFPDQADRDRSANVLFAARLLQVQKFAAFEFDRPPLIPDIETPIQRTSQNLDRVDQILHRAKSWSDEELIDEYEYKDIKTRARDLVFAEESAGRPT